MVDLVSVVEASKRYPSMRECLMDNAGPRPSHEPGSAPGKTFLRQKLRHETATGRGENTITSGARRVIKLTSDYAGGLQAATNALSHGVKPSFVTISNFIYIDH